MVETQQLLWNPLLNQWQEQTISTLSTARAIPAASVVYRPGAVVAGYIYESFSGAVDAINESGAPTNLYVDDSAGAPIVPSGVYNLALVSLMGMPGQSGVVLNLMDGVQFIEAPGVIGGGLSLHSHSSMPVIDQIDLVLALKDGSSLFADGYAPFIHVGAGASAELALYDASLLASSASPVVSSDGYSVMTSLSVGNWSDIGVGALDGYGAMVASLISSSASVEAQSTAHDLTVNTVGVAPGGGGDYACFFAMMPGDNSATVGVGVAVQFPQNGPASGSIARTSASTINLPSVGDYEVSWQVSVSEPGQLQLAIGGVGLPHTVVGRASGTSQLVGSTIISTSVANSVLSVINPVGNSTALTITPIAGGANSVSATLMIKSL